MRFGEELRHLSELLRISAETILRISCVLDEDRAQLDSLAMEVDVLADRLRKIGSHTKQSPRH